MCTTILYNTIAVSNKIRYTTNGYSITNAMAEPKIPTAAPQESGEKPKKEAPKIVAANEDAEKKLKQASKPEKETQKKKEEPVKKQTEKQPQKETVDKKPEPAKPEKKEKNWRLVHGSLSVQNNDWSARTETIGIGVENKTGTKQILIGPTVTQERAPSGATIENLHPIGITGRINF